MNINSTLKLLTKKIYGFFIGKLDLEIFNHGLLRSIPMLAICFQFAATCMAIFSGDVNISRKRFKSSTTLLAVASLFNFSTNPFKNFC